MALLTKEKYLHPGEELTNPRFRPIKNMYPNIPKICNSKHSPDAQETVTSTSDRGVMGSNPICRETGGSSMVEHDTPSPSFLGAFSSMKRRAS